MPIVTKPVPGTLSWAELGTTDAPAARAFYQSLFAWGVKEIPMGPDGVYTIYTLDGKDTAAMYTLRDDMLKQGVPPHWMVYFAVESADAAAAKAAELGATIVMAPFDVMDAGRMAVIKDPVGAVFSIWQAGKNCGCEIVNEIGCPSWPELVTKDLAAAEAFYTKMFGWRAKQSKAAKDETQYVEWYVGPEPVGGMLRMEEEWGPMPPHWGLYFQVEDCDGAAAKAAALGGKICVPVMAVPGVGRMAAIIDPQGASFNLIELQEAA